MRGVRGCGRLLRNPPSRAWVHTDPRDTETRSGEVAALCLQRASPCRTPAGATGEEEGGEQKRNTEPRGPPPGIGSARPPEILLRLRTSAVGREARTDPAAPAGNQLLGGPRRKLRLLTDGAHRQRLQLPEASARGPQNAWQCRRFLIRKRLRNS